MKIFILAIICASFFFGCAKQAAQPQIVDNHNPISQYCASTKWPHEKSELQPDPTIRFGRLKNGLRYIVKQNANPKNRAALYLNVQVGSLHEEQNERGYAHFLEHMVFNGTEHFPPGDLVKFFQEAGMDFGADTNAYTSHSETVYKVILPSGDTQSLAEGLLVLSDFADKALLLEEEVQKESGVILAEKLSRDSAIYRMRLSARQNSLHGSLLAERHPIGIEETLRNATSEDLKRFYKKWYRPDLMVVVVVGDVEVSEIEQLIDLSFGSLRERGEKLKCLDLGTVAGKSLRYFHYHEPDAGKTWVSIKSYWNKGSENDSLDYQLQSLKEYMASRILEKRLERLLEKNTGLFANPQVYAGTRLDRIGYTIATVSTEKNKWKESVAVLENTIRQIVTHGVTPAELERVKREIISFYHEEAAKESSFKTRDIAKQLLWSINNNRVFQSPEQELYLYKPLVQSITEEDVNEAVEKLWLHEDRLLEMIGNAELPEESWSESLAEVYGKAKQAAVEPYTLGNIIPFPNLEPKHPPVNHVDHTYVAEIDTDIYRYANGTILNLKTTEFEKNSVRVSLQFGPGKMGEIKPGQAILARSVLNASGASGVPQVDVDEALAGTTVDYSFNVNAESFSLNGRSLSSEVDGLLHTLFNLMQEPGFEEEVFKAKLIEFQQRYAAMENSTRGAETLFIDDFLVSGSNLYSLPTLDELGKVAYSELRQWITTYMQKAAIEITIVGDVDKRRILANVDKYFGALEKRQVYPTASPSITFPSGEFFEKKVVSDSDKSILVLSWKTEGFSTIERVRRLNMLSYILEERLNNTIREKLGASYSPDVENTSSRIVDDFGYIKSRMIVNAHDLETVKKAALEICEKLVKEGVDEEELKRAKEPLLTSLRDILQTNRYWGRVLKHSSKYPDQLVWPLNILEDNRSITADEITQLARLYLQPELTATAIIRPR